MTAKRWTIPVSATSMTVTLNPSASRMRLAHSHPRRLLDLRCKS